MIDIDKYGISEIDEISIKEIKNQNENRFDFNCPILFLLLYLLVISGMLVNEIIEIIM